MPALAKSDPRLDGLAADDGASDRSHPDGRALSLHSFAVGKHQSRAASSPVAHAIPGDELDGLYWATNYVCSALLGPLRRAFPVLDLLALVWVRTVGTGSGSKVEARVYDPSNALVPDPQWLREGRANPLDPGRRETVERFIHSVGPAERWWRVDVPERNDGAGSPPWTAHWFLRTKGMVSSTGPVAVWLAAAANTIAKGASDPSAAGMAEVDPASHELADFGERAVKEWVARVLGDSLRLKPDYSNGLLAWLRGISVAREEGRSVTGSILVVQDARLLEPHFEFKFPEHRRPSLADAKRVTKLLNGVSESSGDHVLVAYPGGPVLGVARGPASDGVRPRIMVRFIRGYARVLLGPTRLCEIRDGRLLPPGGFDPWGPIYDGLGGLASGWSREQLSAHLATLAEVVQDRGHGFTIVVGRQAARIASVRGQSIDCPAQLDDPTLHALVAGLAGIDGALVVDPRGRVHGYGVILDGKPQRDEDPSRGSRFNSALRFERSHAGFVAIVGSADGPMTVLTSGWTRPPTPPDHGEITIHRMAPLQRWLQPHWIGRSKGRARSL